MPPRLIGILKLGYPYMSRANTPKLQEKILHVAFDTEGAAWGLVERATAIDDGPAGTFLGAPMHAFRLNYNRWIRFEAIPFELEEKITPEGWATSPVRP